MLYSVSTGAKVEWVTYMDKRFKVAFLADAIPHFYFLTLRIGVLLESYEG